MNAYCFKSTFAEPATGSAVFSTTGIIHARRQAIVEVVVSEGEVKLPIGIASVKQALDMPAVDGLACSHPDREAGGSRTYP